MKIQVTILLLVLQSFCGFTQDKVKIGAYYFDGWRKATSVHLTPLLVKDFSARQPKWGWVTSTQTIVNEQIKVASKNGLSFFSFCYFYKKESNTPLNNALNFYQNSPNKKLLNFNLLISNHEGYEIGPSNWNDFQTKVLKLLVQPDYLKVGGKPLIVFFSLESLIKQFGSAENVSAVFLKFKREATKMGLKGITIACCVSADPKSIVKAEACGFDLLTGYNYHDVGLYRQKGNIPIENMRITERKIWNSFKGLTKLKYIPVSTLNWDPRPWANKTNKYSTSPYFTGFSTASVANSVQGCVEWLVNNGKNTTSEKIGLLYAWNEYGEGAYLTPSKNGVNVIEGVKKALLIK